MSQQTTVPPAEKPSLFQRLISFFTLDLWQLDVEPLSRVRRCGLQFMRILVTTARGYIRDACSWKASALTYISLVSLVPVLAIMFSFSRSLGMQRKLFDALGVERVVTIVPANEAAADPHAVTPSPGKDARQPHGIRQVEFRIKQAEEGSPANSLAAELPESMQTFLLQVLQYVENTNFAAMGVVGSLILIFSVLCSLSNLEVSFNAIWGVTVRKNICRRFSEYIAILILLPALTILVTTLNSFVSGIHMQTLTERIGCDGAIATQIVCRAIVVLVIIFFLQFLYMYLPNARVKPSAAFPAAVVAGLIWITMLYVYLRLQIGLARFNTIYGTIAALPFFLAVLYANWCVVLLGGELSYAIQYHRVLHLAKIEQPMPAGSCMALAQVVMYHASLAYITHKRFLPEKFGVKNAIPMNQLRYVMITLLRAKLLVQVADDACGESFLPAIPPDQITCAKIEAAFREPGSVSFRSFIKLLPASVSNILRVAFNDNDARLSEIHYAMLVEKSIASNDVPVLFGVDDDEDDGDEPAPAADECCSCGTASTDEEKPAPLA